MFNLHWIYLERSYQNRVGGACRTHVRHQKYVLIAEDKEHVTSFFASALSLNYIGIYIYRFGGPFLVFPLTLESIPICIDPFSVRTSSWSRLQIFALIPICNLLMNLFQDPFCLDLITVTIFSKRNAFFELYISSHTNFL